MNESLDLKGRYLYYITIILMRLIYLTLKDYPYPIDEIIELYIIKDFGSWKVVSTENFLGRNRENVTQQSMGRN